MVFRCATFVSIESELMTSRLALTSPMVAFVRVLRWHAV